MIRRTHDKPNADGLTLETVELSVSEYVSLYDDAAFASLASKRNHRLSSSIAAIDRNLSGNDWYGGLRSPREAQDMLTAGWAEGANRLSQQSATLSPPTIESRKRRPTWYEQGDDLSVDRALVGQWDTAWRISLRVWSPVSNSVDVILRWGGACDQGADSLFWRGAAGVIIADLLESSGYSVRILASVTLSSDGGSNEIISIQVPVKEAEEPLRLDSLAALTCHAGTWRTFGFRALCTTTRELSGSLGQWGLARREPHKIDRVQRDHGEIDDSAIVVGTVSDRESAMAEVQRVIDLLQSRQ